VIAQLGVTLQRLESILVIIDNGDLHESLSFSNLLRVLSALRVGQLFADEFVISSARLSENTVHGFLRRSLS
jgi:hypothetical protein